MSKSKFNKTIYMKIENEGTEDQYLETDANLENLAEVGEEIAVAEYQLVEVHKLTATPVLSHKPAKRK